MDNFSSGIYKKRAIELIRDTKPSPLLVSLCYFIISAFVSVVTPLLTGYDGLLSGLSNTVQAMITAGRTGMSQGEVATLLQQNLHMGGMLLSLALNLCLTIISVGFSWYCLNVARGEKPSVMSLFDGFGSFFKIIWLNIVMSFFIFLWSLLLIVPGIIAAIRYSQAVNVMRDHPNYGALECINESKEIMRGNKLNYFMLTLSFAGWIIIGVALIMLSPVPVVGSALDIWVVPYMGIATALFYVHLTSGKIPERDPRDYDEF